MQSKPSKHIEPHHVFIILLIMLTFAVTIIILVYGYMTYSKTKYVYDKVKKIDDKIQMIQKKIPDSPKEYICDKVCKTNGTPPDWCKKYC